MADIKIGSLRGGQNDTDPSLALPDDQAPLMENVEIFYSMMGERRAGCAPLQIVGSTLETQMVTVHLSQWFPTNRITVPDLFAITAVVGTSAVIAFRSSGSWNLVAPVDPILSAAPEIWNITSQSLNGKLFWAYPSAKNRLHVFSNQAGGGFTLRRTGMDQAPPPTAVDEGVGAFSGVRYYRVRWIEENATGQILRRGEPSTTLTFTPGGAGAGATVSQGTVGVPSNEFPTHWELEASTDNANFYRITTQTIGTISFNDTTAFATGYAAGGVLSEVIGTYLLQESARYLAVDGDRLLTAGHFTDATKQSRITWSPVKNDPGVGNDERLPLAVNNTVDLDNYDGGPITGISSSTNGTWYAFKWAAIYKMTRTGDITRAYDVLTLSKTQGTNPGRGAIPGSIVNGMDENGAACVYFLDPVQGPSRLGPGGLQTLPGLRKTWGRVNLNAQSVITRAVFYPYKQQIHWWIAVDGSDTPNLKIVNQITEGPGRGWTTATGLITNATAVSLYTEWVGMNGVFSLSVRPVIGLNAPYFLQRTDTETSDAGVPYRATIRTRPYLLAGLLNHWGAMTTAILATSNTIATLVVKFIRDYGLEENRVSTSLAPLATEEYVIKSFDNLALSDAVSIQMEFTDP